MSDLFDRLAPRLLAVEGGYTNDPKDPGGETNHGITKKVARANGYTGDMRDLSKDVALSFYREEYWAGPGFDLVADYSQRIAEELFDTGVNMGTNTAAMFLQRSLNALNRQGADYPDLKADGDIGPATIAALAAFLRIRGRDGDVVLCRMLNALQGARYVSIAETTPSSERFVFGWFLQRVA